MQSTRWLSAFCAVLVLNVVVVLSTSLWRLVNADELGSLRPQPRALGEGSPAQDDELAAPEIVTNVLPIADNPSPESQLAEIPFPTTLPDVPSLADPDALKTDPIYQEFRSMFGSSDDDTLTDTLEPPLVRQQEVVSIQYFATLDQRLTTVRHLTLSAQSIAAEAASMSHRGETKKAGQLLKMATNLREMAAELLICEL